MRAGEELAELLHDDIGSTISCRFIGDNAPIRKGTDVTATTTRKGKL